jgi:hypothetical protein
MAIVGAALSKISFPVDGVASACVVTYRHEADPGHNHNDVQHDRHMVVGLRFSKKKRAGDDPARASVAGK